MADKRLNEKLIVQEGLQVTTQSFLTKPVEEMTFQEVFYAKSVLDILAKRVKERTEEINSRLKREVEVCGVVEDEDKGHKVVHLQSGEVTLQRRVSKEPDYDELKEYLEDEEIPLTHVFDEIKVLQLNSGKLDFLVQSRKIDGDEINKMKKVVWALVIEKPDDVKALLG